MISVTSIQDVLDHASLTSTHELSQYLAPGFIVIIAAKKVKDLLFSRKSSSGEYVLNKAVTKFAEFFARITSPIFYRINGSQNSMRLTK